ncbi:chemotaxis response regulator protein-glutamate methylesterase of group 2 operon [Capsulimonas corticalis]|uniref:Protein-glutamate methylesterase/protein-glutamine glutaminase n=1 Tax=Capsulimonas corticalis TaxID=2219043 RepID=A0A402CU46_9BACT|nr:chemotaxis response regulator protein-glutamate methylesterase [Capsulimonas corticalis]BDI28873.1 chemotaxis response regulator protein-glutamate methylesterase of group 2 operon [Capsulimonas corticalis]
MPEPTKVLVVDDSAFMRKMITEIVSRDAGMTVVGQARDGADALQKLDSLQPDVITLDIEMPVKDGYTTLTEIMQKRPTAVVMLSSLTQAGADMTMRCLEAGAVDFVGKPSGSISLDIEKVAAELLVKIRMAATARLRHAPFRPSARAASVPDFVIKRPEPAAPEAPARRAPLGLSAAPAAPPVAASVMHGGSRAGGILVVGSSTGGPRALQTLIPSLPAGLNVPILIVQHMPPGFTASLAKRLDAESPFEVREAAEGDLLRAGCALVAPGGRHLEVDGHGAIHLTDEPPVHGVRPSVDVTLASIHRLYGARATVVLLTGMGKDGARGMKALHDLGSVTFAEDESTCVVYGMPKAAVDLGGVTHLLPLHDLASAVTDSLRSRSVAAMR